jgi:hypothetical protein
VRHKDNPMSYSLPYTAISCGFMAVSRVSILHKQGFSHRAKSIGDLREVTHKTFKIGREDLS